MLALALSGLVTCARFLLLLSFVPCSFPLDMAGHKRRELTTDDLLRMQEGPPSKRARQRQPMADSDGLNDTDSESSHSNVESDSEQGLPGENDSSSEEPGSDGFSPMDQHQERVTSSCVSSRFITRKLPNVSHATKSASTSWNSLGIIAPLQTALASMSIRTPTEIQGACIPPLLAGEFSVKRVAMEATLTECGRQGLYRKRQDGLRKDYCIRASNSAETCSGSVRHFCVGTHTNTVRTSRLYALAGCV
jgi:hypothetical protein